MKFLIDENVHHGLLTVLTQLGHDAAASPTNLTNGKVLALAHAQERILITHDTDFAAYQITYDHPGIILLKIPPRHLEGLESAMKRLLTENASAEALANKLFLVFEDHIDTFPFRFTEYKFE